MRFGVMITIHEEDALTELKVESVYFSRDLWHCALCRTVAIHGLTFSNNLFTIAIIPTRGFLQWLLIILCWFQAKTTKKIVLRMECTECKFRKQIPLKRCKHFELGGDKKRKVSQPHPQLIMGTCRVWLANGILIHLLCLYSFRARWSSSKNLFFLRSPTFFGITRVVNKLPTLGFKYPFPDLVRYCLE